MKSYHFVAAVVEPKIAAMRVAEADLKIAMHEKADAEAIMAGVQQKLDNMQAKVRPDGVSKILTHV
jgi:dynein heavy chain|tara:strand:+ start:2835 stop:3032 length:198 start_codon:yes stop_codon:yes gene_type:complete